MMSKTLVVLLVLLASAIAIVATAQEPEPFYAVAPVQVEIDGGEGYGEQWSYDCYPSAQPAGPHRMTVYFNTPNGMAIYACDLVGRVVIRPVVPFMGLRPAGLFEAGVPERSDA